jgi:hypothetical protein
MEAIEILSALRRAAPALSGAHPDAATLADELGLQDHAEAYVLMEPVLAAGWARVTNMRSADWDRWAITAKGRRALARI